MKVAGFGLLIFAKFAKKTRDCINAGNAETERCVASSALLPDTTG